MAALLQKSSDRFSSDDLRRARAVLGVEDGAEEVAVKRAYRDATSEAPNGILIQVLLVAAHMDNLEVAVDTARSLAPRLYEGDGSNAPGDHLPTFYATFYDTKSIMGLAATRCG